MENGEFLPTLTPELRRFAMSRLRTVRVRRGQTLLGRGARSTDVYFVLEGLLGVVLYSSQGREVILRSLGPGDTFGELSAIDGLPRSASVVAETDARAAALRREDFLICVGSSPAAAMWLARLLAGKVRGMTDKVFELSALNVRARVHCELLRLARDAEVRNGEARLTPAPTHAEIANRIGTHREAVTREMQALARDKVIRHGRRTLEFIDLPKLELCILQAGAEAA